MLHGGVYVRRPQSSGNKMNGRKKVEFACSGGEYNDVNILKPVSVPFKYNMNVVTKASWR